MAFAHSSETKTQKKSVKLPVVADEAGRLKKKNNTRHPKCAFSWIYHSGRFYRIWKKRKNDPPGSHMVKELRAPRGWTSTKPDPLLYPIGFMYPNQCIYLGYLPTFTLAKRKWLGTYFRTWIWISRTWIWISLQESIPHQTQYPSAQRNQGLFMKVLSSRTMATKWAASPVVSRMK